MGNAPPNKLSVTTVDVEGVYLEFNFSGIGLHDENNIRIPGGLLSNHSPKGLTELAVELPVYRLGRFDSELPPEGLFLFPHLGRKTGADEEGLELDPGRNVLQLLHELRDSIEDVAAELAGFGFLKGGQPPLSGAFHVEDEAYRLPPLPFVPLPSLAKSLPRQWSQRLLDSRIFPAVSIIIPTPREFIRRIYIPQFRPSRDDDSKGEDNKAFGGEGLLPGRALHGPRAEGGKGGAKKVILEDLRAIQRTLKREGKVLLIKPAECRKCGFVFKPEIKIPTRCPRCKSEWIEEPRFKIEVR